MKSEKFVNINPVKCINLPFDEIVKIIERLAGKKTLSEAFDISRCFPSPVKDKNDSNWLKKSKIIGINPKIVGTYFNIVKYALTFPEDTLHIMPLWEKGCGGSIYARVNWKLSDEHLDLELARHGYKTPSEQLKLTVNLLHALGKRVGFDVTGHTDKFSEEVFIEPECFEWIKLNENKTAQISFTDSEDVYPLLKNAIIDFLKIEGNSDGTKFDMTDIFFNPSVTYSKRELILFGEDRKQRNARRIALMNFVRQRGFETIPVTEHIPSRPIVFKKIVYENRGDYADFEVVNKNSAAKIFNSITPYRWYKIDNEGYPIVDSQVQKTCNYFFEKVLSFQKEYNFDFLRGDMAHNQIAHSHSCDVKDKNFKSEIWRTLKEKIQKNVPYFASFAESFLSDYYIGGIDDMENKKFDVVLGTSNFLCLDSEFIECVKYYLYISKNMNFAPCIASITNDSDQKENNKFHQSPLANELRYFIQLFISLPGYTGMGFELRNPIPSKNSEYSGIYTNYQKEKYSWGSNTKMFSSVSKMRKLYSEIFDEEFETTILKTYTNDCLVWVLSKNEKPLYLCAVNLDKDDSNNDVSFEESSKFDFENKLLVPVYSLQNNAFSKRPIDASKCLLPNLGFADAKIFKITDKFFNIKTKKNSKQVLFVTTEYEPYAKSGGLADYGNVYAAALKNDNEYDIRVIMPLYNFIEADFSSKEPYIKLHGFDIKFLIQDTEIETEYRYGAFDSYARIYKIKNPVNNVPVYLVYSPVFSEIKKEYKGDIPNLSGAFSAAVCNLIKVLAKSSEKFNPQIIQTNDHITANVGLLIKNLKKYDSFFKNIKTIHTIHNLTDTGEYSALAYLCFFASEKQFELLLCDKEVSVVLEFIKEKYNQNDKISALKFIAKNYSDLKDENILLLDKILQNKVCDFGVSCFNMTKNAICHSKKWVTVSNQMYKSLIAEEYKKLSKINFKANKSKGVGILSGIDLESYNPENKAEIKFPYNQNNFKSEKLKNKLYLQEKFSKENIQKGGVCLDGMSFGVSGYLSQNPDAILLLYAGRTEKIKGFEILAEIIPNMLKKFPNLQMISIGEGLSDVIQDDELKNSGQYLMIDGFLNIKQFFASSDLFLIPSYIETCGLAAMQAMRYGTVVISNLTGCAGEIITPPCADLKTANGFVPKNTYNDRETGVKAFQTMLNEAIEIYSNNINLKNTLIFNCMKYDNSMNKEKIEKYKKLFKSAENDT